MFFFLDSFARTLNKVVSLAFFIQFGISGMVMCSTVYLIYKVIPITHSGGISESFLACIFLFVPEQPTSRFIQNYRALRIFLLCIGSNFDEQFLR